MDLEGVTLKIAYGQRGGGLSTVCLLSIVSTTRIIWTEGRHISSASIYRRGHLPVNRLDGED